MPSSGWAVNGRWRSTSRACSSPCRRRCRVLGAASGCVDRCGLLGRQAAVHNLARTLGADLAARGIRVNSISPGFIDTEMYREAIPGPEAATRDAARVPLGALGHPDQVAAAVAFLASEDASYITGQDLVVDGGLLGSVPGGTGGVQDAPAPRTAPAAPRLALVENRLGGNGYGAPPSRSWRNGLVNGFDQGGPPSRHVRGWRGSWRRLRCRVGCCGR